MLIVAEFCCFFYLLRAWQKGGSEKGDSIAIEITKTADNCSVLPNLEFESSRGSNDCNDFPTRKYELLRETLSNREKKLDCLIPAPNGYVTPFRSLKSRDYVPYANAPHKSLTVEKAVQNWFNMKVTYLDSQVAKRNFHKRQMRI
ncbi:unnamed protein product [Fraxinus pennsylvanica]|uniref:Methyltransferase n=1 Tax=Fraxinus pennsylvanica TaxID=56036 RepID=A0AAD2E1I6_9LAMI|nr:unnamed protein product [Fraxinus pennsylvanica]